MYRTLTSALALCLLAVPASAACIQSDLAGQFRVYALDNERVTYCTVVIDSTGALQMGTPCKQRLNGGQQFNASVGGGSLVLARNCLVTGHLVVRRYARSLTAFIESAQLSQNKESISGVGRDSDEAVFMLSAQRIR